MSRLFCCLVMKIQKGRYLTLQLLRFAGGNAKFRAFTDMGRRLVKKRVAAPVFIRHMGSGAGQGFSLQPDLSTYALVAAWQSAEEAEQHLQGHNYAAPWSEYCEEKMQLLLECSQVHGKWGRKEILSGRQNPTVMEPFAVLTRARIKTSKLWRFWKHVPKSSAAIANAEGCIFSKGIGEWPLITLATISIWDSAEKMQSFAYGDSTHGKIVEKARKEGWFSEELFARFNIVNAQGTFKGFSAKQMTNAKTQS